MKPESTPADPGPSNLAAAKATAEAAPGADHRTAPPGPLGSVMEQAASHAHGAAEEELADGGPDTLPDNRQFANYRDALQAVQATLEKLKACPAEERQEMLSDISRLAEMQEKLTTGRIEIVVFGEISTGKSALINALIGREVTSVNVQGGWTREVWGTTWEGCGYRVPGLEQSEVVLVDTPGINEVQGVDRRQIAEDAARQADLLLFVTDSDLNDTEYSALLELAAVQKPMLVVLNKMDLYSAADRQRLFQVLHSERLLGTVAEQDFVMAAAQPRPVEYLYEQPDGSEIAQWRTPPPEVAELKGRILEILEREGKGLLALNAAMFAADKTDRVKAVRIALRRRYAQQVIWSFASFKAIVVGVTFVPLLDIVSGFTIDVMMIVALSQVYGIQFSMNKARELAWSILKSVGWVAGMSYAMDFLATGLKALSFGLATPLTAIPQGAAAGWTSYVVGQAAEYYFQHGGSWGSESPKTVIRQILADTDKSSVLAGLKDEIRKKLTQNRHAQS
jgi:GTPase